ncbi:MAG TPA: PLP-dependent aminotransferase family protein, partial [Firmicutes bacterium]|nr:PLP-dependent aminotransferase family protein [Bacillota bacterium]
MIEDDYVGDLRYEGRAQSSLKALDPGGRVIYTGTFSKMLLPGLRIGFLLAEGPIYRVLTERKYVHDIAASNLMQRVLEVYLSIGRYRNYLRRSCKIYRERRDAMIKAIGEYLPASVSFDKPKGGLFVWLALPRGLAAEKLSRIALTEGVCCAQGKTFFTDQGAPRGAFDIRSDTGCS